MTIESPLNTRPAHLQQVAPLPMNELVPEESADAPKKQPKLVKSIISFLLKAQKYSAYGFLAFFGLHASSVVVAPALGISSTGIQDYFEMTRAVYLSPLFEYPVVHGCALAHVFSGVSIRILRLLSSQRTKRATAERDIVIQDVQREDIGLGGIGSIFGFGFKKSWISSTIPSLTPLTFSGYVLSVGLLYHMWKMKWRPIIVDGDSSLVTLNFITHYLSPEINGKGWAAFNLAMLGLLLWVSFYHMVSGLFKYRRQVSSRAKKIAYGIITAFTTMSFISIGRFMLWPLDVSFIGKQFNKYLL